MCQGAVMNKSVSRYLRHLVEETLSDQAVFLFFVVISTLQYAVSDKLKLCNVCTWHSDIIGDVHCRVGFCVLRSCFLEAFLYRLLHNPRFAYFLNDFFSYLCRFCILQKTLCFGRMAICDTAENVIAIRPARIAGWDETTRWRPQRGAPTFFYEALVFLTAKSTLQEIYLGWTRCTSANNIYRRIRLQS